MADRLAVLVNHVYANPTTYEGWPLLLAAYCFSFQIFCDFSGYSDIALGAAQVMGFKLMRNFNRPYFSKSIEEFWTRWHISLSTWFRDYLYIPLGGNRVSQSRWCLNVLTVFLLSGLWHGASWTFIIWGSLHGIFVIVSRLSAPLRNTASSVIGLRKWPAMENLLAVFVTFNLVTLAWIFFRAETLDKALYITAHLFTGHGADQILNLGLNSFELLVAAASIVTLEVVHLIERRVPIAKILSPYPAWVRWPCYYAAIAVILILGNFNSQQFIYFQF